MIRRNLLVPLIAFSLACAPPVVLGFAACSQVQEQPSNEEQNPPRTKEAVQLIDINRASVEELAKLPGIGPELGRRIVAFREKHGPFRRVEDLLVIRGVGQKKWKAMRPLVRVGNDAEKTKMVIDRRGKNDAGQN